MCSRVKVRDIVVIRVFVVFHEKFLIKKDRFEYKIFFIKRFLSAFGANRLTMSDDCGPDMCCADDGVCDAVDYGGDDGYVGGDDLTRNRVPTAIDYHRQCKEIQEEIAQIEQDNDTLLEIFAQARDGCNKNTRKRFSALMERTNNNLAAKKKQKQVRFIKPRSFQSKFVEK